MGLAVVVVLCALGSLFGLLGGVLMVMLAGAVGRAAASEGTEIGVAVFVVLGVALALISLAMLAVGFFLWQGCNWARITFMVLLGMHIARDIYTLVALGGGVVSVIYITLGLVFLAMLNTAETRGFCTL